ncbi:FAD/NAD(P)-binding oxidoreductase family protein [Rhynchospora pubera]|uniref:FAD/NAD(P)-binding oxidoreductase family protein n=1 Tax=Rhynchospora pubera TaxID=906938 RepID=A0AAV8DSU6_9POAL|nr:FAD/NAD(P)-binding oxidoreductase family protein [Rhynchospora pubera]
MWLSKTSCFLPFIFRRSSCSFRVFCTASANQRSEQLLLVVGGGAAGVYASIHAKSLAPMLNVMVIEKGKLLSKVKISGGGRCNVTNGHFFEPLRLAENYPRGYRELKWSFFDVHGPQDTMNWFSNHGIQLKTEDDGRVFPVTDNSASIVDCLLNEARRLGVLLQTGNSVTNVSVIDDGQFLVKVEKRTANLVEKIKANYVLVCTGSSQQGYSIAAQLGHSIIDPMPSLFTFKISHESLPSLSGVSFPKVRAKLKLDHVKRNIPELTQVGPLLVTHWGLSGPVILRLSAWGARELFHSNYRGMLYVDFIPDINIEEVKKALFHHRDQLAKNKLNNSFPLQFSLPKRFWRLLISEEGLDGDVPWATVSNSNLNSIALLLKQFLFKVAGKGQFKDEFVTAGGVPLSEISLNTMGSKKCRNFFFAGEVLNVDGITGGFNFQNAWTGGYIAGTTIGTLASSSQNASQLSSCTAPCSTSASNVSPLGTTI